MNLRANIPATPVLRLVGGSAEPIGLRLEPVDREQAARQILRENRAASLGQDLDPCDPRWVLAARTRRELQGAALTAERRERLLSLAHQLHMRPFDANMVIAIVQDEARLAMAGADSTWELADRLRIIPQRDRTPAGSAMGEPSSPSPAHRRGMPVSLLLLFSALLGVTGLLTLLGWLSAG